MSQISCRVTRTFLEAAEQHGLDARTIAAGTSCSLATLRDVRLRITWAEFADFCDSLERLSGGPDALIAIGASAVRAPSFPFSGFAKYLVATHHLHALGSRYIGPAAFPELPIEILELNERRFVARCVLPSSYRGCASFFHICRGGLGAMSTSLGLPPSIVEGTVTDRSALFDITLPRDPRRIGALLHRARAWLAGIPIDELLRRQDEVNDSYRALLRSRQEFRDVLERAPMGAAVHRDGRYVWANSALAQMLGREHPGELVGRALLDDVHPLDRDRVAQWLVARATSDQGRTEYRVRRGDGGTAVWESAGTQEVVFDGTGARLLLASDVTERTRAREQLALSERMSSLGMIAAAVAHEINNPLTYVQLSVQAIGREALDDHVSSALRGAAATALEGLARVRSIVDDLRTFSRAEGEPVGGVDVNEVITTTLRLAEQTLRGSAKLEVELEDVSAVRGDRGKLGQVVLNLLANAHDAVEDRGVDGIIRVRSRREPAGGVSIEVSDNGVGVPLHARARVFEPFFTTKPAGRGTGLGLALCHRIVRSYGGEITLEPSTEEPLRTIARVRLKPAETSEVREPASPIAPPTSRRILVVDDEPAVGRAIEAALCGEHEVQVVSGGRAALAALRSDDRFDVVLCDVMMPDVDGIALFEETRASAPELAGRFVFMSGGAFTPRARAFLASCTNPRLEKPFSVEQLSAAIARGS